MRFKTTQALAVAAALALGATACGDSSPKPVAKIRTLTGYTTAVKLDAAFVEALTSLKVAPGTIGDARITSTGSAVFPITGGDLTYYKPGSVSPSVQGRIFHEGSGLTLTAGRTEVTLRDFLIFPGKSLLTANFLVNGKLTAESTPLFFLDGRTLKPLAIKTSNNTAVLEGTTVKLKRQAADLLDKAFKTDALKPGLLIGVAKITVNAS